MLEVLRRRQTHFARHTGAPAAHSSTADSLRRIVREKEPIVGVVGEERARLRNRALSMLPAEISSSLDDEAYREIIRE